MALKACKECGKEVSTSAIKCPHCGVSNPTLTNEDIGRGCLGIILIAVVIAIFAMMGSGNETQRPLTAQELRAKSIEKHFSAWDGSHVDLTRIIKTSMNDPNSYEHIETTYSDNGKTLFDNSDHLLVITEFRGTNAFGAKIRSVVRAKTSNQTGKVIEILSQE